MSRIGLKPVVIPQNVKAEIKPGQITVSGPKGELEVDLPRFIEIRQKDGRLNINRKEETKLAKSLHGTLRSLVNNAVIGVSEGFEKILELVGIGYKAVVDGEHLVLNLGFTHPVKVKIPPQLKVFVEKNFIKISGIDKQQVGHFAASIRRVRPPEPYKGKGIRYRDERIRMKQGKATKGASS